MSVSEAGPARQFTASKEAFSTSWIKGTKIWQAVYTVFFVAFLEYAVTAAFGVHIHVPRNGGLIFFGLSAADWLMLVEKFGLAADLQDTARNG